RKDLTELHLMFSDWHTFSSRFSPTPSLRLHLRGSEALRGGRFRFHAELSEPRSGRHEPQEITATGPVSACTQLLSRAGRGLEIITFRQVELHEATATFILAHHPHHHERRRWAFGFGATPDASIASAMSAAAQRIHG
ncbi:MAG TPA: acetyl-CoA acetyltransferase, partial [Corynebacterium sp.]|nr:acetyl-CoA acetyltransferase [Corynebacterium sp.]